MEWKERNYVNDTSEKKEIGVTPTKRGKKRESTSETIKTNSQEVLQRKYEKASEREKYEINLETWTESGGHRYIH